MRAVQVPILDLRAQPRTAAALGAHDALQETQLLYGERARVLKRDRDWVFVEAVEQPEFSHARRWQGYPGWVPEAALAAVDPEEPPTIVITQKWAVGWRDARLLQPSPWRFPIGARLAAVDMGGQVWQVRMLDGGRLWLAGEAARALDEVRALPPAEKRRLIIRAAELLIGDPYVWGGRSPGAGDPALVAGVDCSGLVSLAYRAAGVEIPRDAHEQSLRAEAVAAPRPGDLIFLSERGDPSRIVHVMLYAGEDEIIEGPGTGKAVRRIRVAERLGHPLAALPAGSTVDGQAVSFGAYVP